MTIHNSVSFNFVKCHLRSVERSWNGLPATDALFTICRIDTVAVCMYSIQCCHFYKRSANLNTVQYFFHCSDHWTTKLTSRMPTFVEKVSVLYWLYYSMYFFLSRPYYHGVWGVVAAANGWTEIWGLRNLLYWENDARLGPAISTAWTSLPLHTEPFFFLHRAVFSYQTRLLWFLKGIYFSSKPYPVYRTRR